MDTDRPAGRGTQPRPILGSAETDSNGDAIITLEQLPRSGYAWDLRRIVVVSSDIITIDAGALVVVAFSFNAGPILAEDVVTILEPDPPGDNGLPVAVGFSRGEAVAFAGQYIQVGIYHATHHGLVVIANGQVEEYRL